MTYHPPFRDMRFALHEVLDTASVLSSAGIEIDRDTIDGVLEGAGEICARVIAPLNGPGDVQGVRRDDEGVHTPDGFQEAYERYVAGGWPSVDADEHHGGGGLPLVVGSLIKEMLASANPSWALYTSLSAGVYRCINANADEELKQAFLPNLASGRWTGTMCLTEPHCGTDLGLLTTRAVPRGDGAYRISGTKIFITSGDHDLTDNIVHLVLARTPDAPAGTRGISLFAVPKRRITDDGEPGPANGVHCDGLESKMGLHGSATCVLRFDDAVGHLVGEESRGLAAMFVMMNGARLGTGVMALGVAETAGQAALAFSRERLQSRAPGSLHDPAQPADPIIDQPDVRRMLLTQQAWVGGSRLFLYWLSLQTDLRREATDLGVRVQADDLLSLLTPVAKAFVSDRAVEVSSLAMQVLGGAGYITDNGVEQSLRDARILPIYEGTNGVQAHDLLARKVIGDGGRRMKQLLEMVSQFTDRIAGTPELAPFGTALSTLTEQIRELNTELIAGAEQDELRVGTSAVDYLDLVGHYLIAWFWAQAAETVVTLGDAATAYHERQLALAHFYIDKMLPTTAALVLRARSSTAVLMNPAAIAG
ncbi:Butyryl-CoA dehydrogenase (plasmid) [Pseudonocardia dioxanivorans CB1190]|uniref:3-methylmercaptopropionyl-CoA dehydrogenase n=1 Tax=Pseudonocardia dioxanivorans (strain ATCC 55486 / DSM 44775 / JCM 13855 / CB1190) TaxID=675635 RepID=F2L6X8_PSEUX|nr:acyl-CoA dehydrogenase C-terminal domain-containing protein [Pseudonocardia dioxanivorans]AEA28850.1 Butyryl-CoA dehydrogenase [Pseudonocardia dioxanivorans CB1190]